MLTAAAALQAREVSPQEALSAARDFLGTSAPRKAAPAVLNQSSINDAAQPYYLFNSTDSEGFVIISGDDRAPKVLGYSDSGTIDPSNLPPQLKAILARFAEGIDKLPDVKHKSWSKAPTRSEEKGVLIPTANWGQGYPYNTECPEKDGEPTLTGCVATAMAIAMKHHNWPESYDWDAMPMNTEADPLDFEKDSPELARLMHDAGEAVFMEYDPYESGAYLDWIGHRMQYVFHYSPECQYLGWENYELENWNSMLKAQLDKGNPVIYDGFGSGGHHAFILDGYDGDELYHVNWGWNGMGNGYYALLDLTPFEGENFSDHQGMVINIEPDHDMGEYSECFVDFGYLWALGSTHRAAEMNLSVENIETGKPFQLINDRITITPGFEGIVGVAIVDKDDNIKEVLRTHHVSSFQEWNNSYSITSTAIRYYDLIPTCEIVSSDRLQLVSKHDKDDKFRLMLGTMEWPSSRPVTGNTPKRCKVIFNIGEGIQCIYSREGDPNGSIEVPTGQTVVDALIGEYYAMNYGKVDPTAEDPISMELHGNFFGGNMESWTGHEPTGYGFGVYAEENIADIKLLHLEGQAIHLDEAGTLKEKLAAANLLTLGDLALTGKMNATDFWFLRDNCRNLTSLDLSGVTIEEYTGGDGSGWISDDMVHPANAIPYMAIPSLTNLATLILPENLEAIEGFSLQGLKLQSISIPAGVKSIGRDAFYGNYELEAVEVYNPEVIEMEFSPFDDTKCPANGVLFLPEGGVEAYAQAEFWKDFGRILEKPMPVPLKSTFTLDNVVYSCYIDEATITGWEGEPVDIVIPETFVSDGIEYTVTAIGNDAFNNCSSLESFTMPNSVKEMGYNAFFFCSNLRSIKLSENIKEIQYYTFAGCRSLEDFTITPNIELLGSHALYGTGLTSLFIPKTLAVNTSDSPFGGHDNLEEFTVEEGSECFKAIDGNLYRIFEKGLTLESIPGKKEGILEIPDECKHVMRGALDTNLITDLIFNDGLETISEYALFGSWTLQHLSLPSSVFISPNAIYDSYALESVTFHGTPGITGPIFYNCPVLRHIYVNAPEGETVKLDGLFAEEYENLNIYSPKLDPDFEYAGNHTIFVPGACASRHELSRAANVVEMWKYGVSPAKGLISIVPQIEGLKIEKVTINGRVVKPTTENGTFYQIEEDTPEVEMLSEGDASDKNPDVQVEYTLHGRQTMTTHYTPEFNAALPDDLPTAIETIAGDSAAEIEIYSLDGTLLFKGNDKSALGRLAPGVYLTRRGNQTRKVCVGR